MRLADVAAKLPGSVQKSHQFLNENKIRGCTVNPDGGIYKNGSVDLIYFQGEKLPVQFERVSEDFIANNVPLRSLIGFPIHVGRDLHLEHTPILSLEGIPQTIGGDIFLTGIKLRSLSGIDKRIKRMGGSVLIDKDMTHLLGLLAIEGLEQVVIDRVLNDNPLARILNKYIHQGDHDIIAAQDELIDAGFKEQARL